MAENAAGQRKGEGRKRKKWLGAIFVAGVLFVFVAYPIILRPPRADHSYPFGACRSHIEQCRRALMRYVEEHGGVFPRFENDTDWVQTALPNFTDDKNILFEVLHCPETVHQVRRAADCGGCRKAPPVSVTDYVFNMKLCSRKLAEVSPEELVLQESHSFGHSNSPLGITVEGATRPLGQSEEAKP